MTELEELQSQVIQLLDKNLREEYGTSISKKHINYVKSLKKSELEELKTRNMKRKEYLYMVWAESPSHTTHSGYFFTAYEARVEAARLRKIYKGYKISIEKILKKDY